MSLLQGPMQEKENRENKKRESMALPAFQNNLRICDLCFIKVALLQLTIN